MNSGPLQHRIQNDRKWSILKDSERKNVIENGIFGNQSFRYVYERGGEREIAPEQFKVKLMPKVWKKKSSTLAEVKTVAIPLEEITGGKEEVAKLQLQF